LSKYSITISKQARKQLRDIPRKDRLRISGAIELLGDNPIPPKALKLTNRDGYRLRVGDYRIIYIFNSNKLFILIINIAQRSAAYQL
jgi:mRNA interferase RelE/StbE